MCIRDSRGTIVREEIAGQDACYLARLHSVSYTHLIEKDSAINDEIERLRHSATSALFERRDVIVVASVSCIYGLGDPIDYANMVILSLIHI